MTDRLEYPDPPLRDGDVLLRRWVESDTNCVRAASDDPVIPTGTTIPADYTPEEGLAWIRRQWGRQDEGGISLAIAEGGRGAALGTIVLQRLSTPGSVSIGYWLLAQHRGQGYGSAAVRLLSRWALTEGGVERIEAYVEPENAASLALLRSVGYRREGLLRSYLAFEDRRADAEIWSLLPHDL